MRVHAFYKEAKEWVGLNGKTNMNKTPFEDFLKEKHLELHPQLLDDDLPDAFDNWLGELDGEDYIKYGNEALVEAKEQEIKRHGELNVNV